MQDFCLWWSIFTLLYWSFYLSKGFEYIFHHFLVVKFYPLFQLYYHITIVINHSASLTYCTAQLIVSLQHATCSLVLRHEKYTMHISFYINISCQGVKGAVSKHTCVQTLYKFIQTTCQSVFSISSEMAHKAKAKQCDKMFWSDSSLLKNTISQPKSSTSHSIYRSEKRRLGQYQLRWNIPDKIGQPASL